MHDKDLIEQGTALILEGLVGPEWQDDPNYCLLYTSPSPRD